MEGVVYKYTNQVTHKVYIGATINEKKRMERWRTFRLQYAGEYLEYARMEYGWKAWDYEVLARIKNDNRNVLREELDKLECLYISQYRSDEEEFGYNKTKGGRAGFGQQWSEKARANASKSQKGIKKQMSEQGRKNISDAHKGLSYPSRHKAVVQLTKDGHFIAEYESITSAARINGLRDSNISAALRHVNGTKMCGGFKWVYSGNYKKQ